MEKEDLNLVLQEGEGLKTEFKEKANPKDLSKEMVAFANSEGGKIFLGVGDSGEVKGIETGNKIKSQVQDIANNCDPKLDVFLEEIEFDKSKKILVINIEEGRDKPYRCSSGFFIRVGANSQKLSRNEIFELMNKLGKVNFDEQENAKFEFNKDFDKNKFDSFLKKAGISGDSSIKDMLINLSLGNRTGRKFRANNACVLLFSKNPHKFFRQNFVTCVLYKGKERVEVVDRKDFTDTLFENYDDVINFLKKHLNLSYVIEGTGPRKEVLELPEAALREAVLNSLVHRDYFDNRVGVFVEIFDDRVEIYNKGKLLFSKKDLGKTSVPRNPMIFDIFHRAGNIEKIGSGINRIKNLMKKRKLNVRFESSEFFRVVFYRKKSKELSKEISKNEGWSEKWSEKWSEISGRKKEILELIRRNSKISREELSKSIGINQSAVQKHIDSLKQKGVLERVGAAKGGYWKIITEKDSEKQ